jgi:hypothetical protein
MPYIIRVSGLGDPLALARLRSLTPMEQVMFIQNSVFRGRGQIGNVFVYHYPGKAAISIPGTSLGVSHSRFNPLRQGGQRRPWHDHMVSQASALCLVQPVIVYRAGKPQLAQNPTQRLVTQLLRFRHCSQQHLFSPRSSAGSASHQGPPFQTQVFRNKLSNNGTHAVDFTHKPRLVLAVLELPGAIAQCFQGSLPGKPFPAIKPGMVNLIPPADLAYRGP